MSKQLPKTVHEAKGGLQVAIDRTADIAQYVERAVECLTKVKDEKGEYVRAGYLQQGDETLDTIIRFAKCAKDLLREAYCPQWADDEK